jgi:hypothetical protein
MTLGCFRRKKMRFVPKGGEGMGKKRGSSSAVLRLNCEHVPEKGLVDHI